MLVQCVWKRKGERNGGGRGSSSSARGYGQGHRRPVSCSVHSSGTIHAPESMRSREQHLLCTTRHRRASCVPTSWRPTAHRSPARGSQGLLFSAKPCRRSGKGRRHPRASYPIEDMTPPRHRSTSSFPRSRHAFTPTGNGRGATGDPTARSTLRRARPPPYRASTPHPTGNGAPEAPMCRCHDNTRTHISRRTAVHTSRPHRIVRVIAARASTSRTIAPWTPWRTAHRHRTSYPSPATLPHCPSHHPTRSSSLPSPPPTETKKNR